MTPHALPLDFVHPMLSVSPPPRTANHQVSLFDMDRHVVIGLREVAVSPRITQSIQ